MKDVKKWFLPLAIVIFSPTLAHAANGPVAGTIVSEASVECGTKGSKKKSIELLCQEYVVHAGATDYHVRQPKPENQALIPVNTKIMFTIDKSKMKFKADSKSYEYVVVSEAAGGQS